MTADILDTERLFPLRVTAAEMEAYRQFLITLATVIPVDNPIYLDAAKIIDRLEEFAEREAAS